MKRWGAGVSGALKMGTYHGLSCLGCWWPYFLIMVALGWMNILWMGLFEFEYNNEDAKYSHNLYMMRI
jgi:predicted metal-binding membrane protein